MPLIVDIVLILILVGEVLILVLKATVLETSLLIGIVLSRLPYGIHGRVQTSPACISHINFRL